MSFELGENTSGNTVNIKVIGVGGGGNNAVNRMIECNIKGVHYLAVNTDQPVLDKSRAESKIAIGLKTTRGQGAGADPEVGMRAAEESIEDLAKALQGVEMVFITAGMGGGTGTGAAPVIAKLAKEMGILTVGIVTKPFGFEGKQRMRLAEGGIANLREYVDSLIVVPNERLKDVSETPITLRNAFEIADDVLVRGVQSISELINESGYINLDFADVTSIMKNAGYAHMSMGSATGSNKAKQAAEKAISSPLLETSIEGAKGIIVNITASDSIGLDEIDIASSLIADRVDPAAKYIWGVSFDNRLEDEINITVIATGFNGADKLDQDNLNATQQEQTQKVEEAKEEESEEKNDTETAKTADDQFWDLINILNSNHNQ